MCTLPCHNPIILTLTTEHNSHRATYMLLYVHVVRLPINTAFDIVNSTQYGTAVTYVHVVRLFAITTQYRKHHTITT